MKRIIALSICLLVFGLIGCSSGGGSGSSSDSISGTTSADFVGTWSMVSSEGESCSGCVLMTFNADGTGSVNDVKGYFTGVPGTIIQGTWSYAGGYLTITSDDETYYESDPASIDGNILTYGVNVYQRQ